MSQIPVRSDQLSSGQFCLDGNEAHHVIRVLRKKKGDELFLFNAMGSRFRGVVTEVDRELTVVRGRVMYQPAVLEKTTRLRLFQGLPKGSKIDYVIEKAVELGADEIIPFLSDKSLIRLQPSQAAAKQARWMRLAQAAAKQCDRPTVPTVHPARPLRETTTELRQGFTLVFSQHTNSGSFRSQEALRGKSIINLVVGPESGFSKSELDWLIGLGAKPVSLGGFTLRTETAGLTALTLANYELGFL